MAHSRRTRILILFGLVMLLPALAAWLGLRRAASSETADALMVPLLALFLALALGLAAVGVRAEAVFQPAY